MKKRLSLLSIILVACMLASALASCSGKKTPEPTISDATEQSTQADSNDTDSESNGNAGEQSESESANGESTESGDRQESTSEKETEEGTKEGRVLICLRKSTRDGYYDVVVEDNGHGVKEENLDKLFTPNFTTKSSGTGLGLAICRNIIEKCEGEIRYQKSHLLGGASFIVTLPVHEV